MEKNEATKQDWLAVPEPVDVFAEITRREIEEVAEKIRQIFSAPKEPAP